LFADALGFARAHTRELVTVEQFRPSIRVCFVRYCLPICYARVYASGRARVTAKIVGM